MKKHLSKWVSLALIVAALVAGNSFSASAQVYVRVRPTPPVIVRTDRPSPRHVWVGEEWEARNGAYVHTGGHWSVPPHRHEVWISGHWSHNGRGSYWRPGHWGRR